MKKRKMRKKNEKEKTMNVKIKSINVKQTLKHVWNFLNYCIYNHALL